MAVSARPRTSSSGYEKLRVSHKRAYAYLSKALEIDERGVGKRARLRCWPLSEGQLSQPWLVIYCMHCMYVERAMVGSRDIRVMNTDIDM